MSLPTTITQHELAERMGVTQQMICRLVKDGVLQKRKDGKLDYTESLSTARAFYSSQRAQEKVQGGRQAMILKKLELQCQRLQIDNDAALGKLIPITDVSNSLRKVREIEKQILLSIPGRIAAPYGELSNEIETSATNIVLEVLDRLYKDSYGNGNGTTH